MSREQLEEINDVAIIKNGHPVGKENAYPSW